MSLKKTLKDVPNELRELDCQQLENELYCNPGTNCNIDWDYYVSEQFLNYQRADYLLFMNDYVFYILEEKGCQI